LFALAALGQACIVHDDLTYCLVSPVVAHLRLRARGSGSVRRVGKREAEADPAADAEPSLPYYGYHGGAYYGGVGQVAYGYPYGYPRYYGLVRSGYKSVIGKREAGAEPESDSGVLYGNYDYSLPYYRSLGYYGYPYRYSYGGYRYRY